MRTELSASDMIPAMKKKLSNFGEKRLHEEIAGAVSHFKAEIYRKVRIADVVDIKKLSTRSLGTYALQAHFDICVCDEDDNPAFTIEYDGAGHDSAKDNLKNTIAREADLALFRIDETLLSRTCGGMTFLQYLVHIWFMGLDFKHWQDAGHVGADEPFMMSSFIRLDAKSIFDSEYDFTHPPLRRIGKLLTQAGLGKPLLSRAMLSISSVMLANNKSSFIGFCSMPFGSVTLYGRAKLEIGTPCLGALDELPFGWSALSDFCEGMALNDLCDNAEVSLAGGGNTILTETSVLRELEQLKKMGYSMLRGGSSGDSRLIDAAMTRKTTTK